MNRHLIQNISYRCILIHFFIIILSIIGNLFETKLSCHVFSGMQISKNNEMPSGLLPSQNHLINISLVCRFSDDLKTTIRAVLHILVSFLFLYSMSLHKKEEAISNLFYITICFFYAITSILFSIFLFGRKLRKALHQVPRIAAGKCKALPGYRLDLPRFLSNIP